MKKHVDFFTNLIYEPGILKTNKVSNVIVSDSIPISGQLSCSC